MNTSIRPVSVIAILTILAACGGGVSVEEHITRANQFISESKYDSAIIELKNVLQEDKESAQARWLLGKIYLDSGDVRSAEKELQHALKLKWPEEDVIPALAISMLAQGKFDEVSKLRAASLTAPAKASLLASKAMAAMGRGESKKAADLTRRALESAPDSTAALLANARILASQGDIVGAIDVLDTLLEIDPKDAAAWQTLGDLRMLQKELEPALVAYDTALKLKPNNYNVLFRRALLSLQLGDTESAQADTTALLLVIPQHPGGNYIEGLLHFQAERYADAVTTLSLAEPVYKQFPQILFFLSSALLVEGDIDPAGVQASRFHDLLPESIRGRKLLATIRLQQGKYQEVEKLLRPVIDARPNDVDALNLMSNALLRTGKTDQGIAMLAKVAELQPDSAAAQVRLGAGLLVGGNTEDATGHIEAALALNPEFHQADILLVLNHVQKGNFEAAIKAAKDYRRRNLTSGTPLNLLGRVYLAAGDKPKAKESFEKALALDKGDPAANNNLAQMAIADGNLVAARKYFNTILGHHENYLPALLQLALLDAKEQQEELLIGHLEQAIEFHPEAIEPRILLGRYHLSEGRPEKVAIVFSDLKDAQKQLPQVQQLTALAQLSANEHGQAKYTLEQLIENSPDTASYHHLMAMASAGTGDLQRSEKELHRALELAPNYLPSRIALAKMAISSGDTVAFDGHLKELTALAPENSEVLLLRAIAASQDGDLTAAIELAEKAYELAPSTASVLALAMHKEADEDPLGAMELYQNWADKNPEDIVVRIALADKLYRQGKTAKAMTHYEQILAIDPDNVVALNNLAWHIREQDPVKALSYARKANNISPDSAAILDTLAVVEFVNKEYSQARRSIERALSHSPEDPSLRYHSAMILAALDNKTEATKILETLTSEAAEFPELAEAQALLQTLSAQ
ncbi:MAG: XrtA/PEP-CTERM system TPR-repeat protein PrsT [Halioglobus sp.]